MRRVLGASGERGRKALSQPVGAISVLVGREGGEGLDRRPMSLVWSCRNGLGVMLLINTS